MPSHLPDPETRLVATLWAHPLPHDASHVHKPVPWVRSSTVTLSCRTPVPSAPPAGSLIRLLTASQPPLGPLTPYPLSHPRDPPPLLDAVPLSPTALRVSPFPAASPRPPLGHCTPYPLSHPPGSASPLPSSPTRCQPATPAGVLYGEPSVPHPQICTRTLCPTRKSRMTVPSVHTCWVSVTQPRPLGLVHRKPSVPTRCQPTPSFKHPVPPSPTRWSLGAVPSGPTAWRPCTPSPLSYQRVCTTGSPPSSPGCTRTPPVHPLGPPVPPPYPYGPIPTTAHPASCTPPTSVLPLGL
ncbi:hypothetical protein GDO86_019441 [Hymenochirus boettgeri]|uniref:Uncharacterized protein n=1 Tax=Hymenochirus boettgeri TaxID=247094 RepID=A0A8T2IG50_9PIPI|nr:hypothetical protein GDO86_019441 [Hymenochirus boettgeri]